MPDLSFDPGYRGGVAIWDDPVRVIPMPTMQVGTKRVYDLEAIVALIKAAKPKRVVIEQVTRPGVLIGNMNFIHGVALACGANVTRIRPQEWRKMVGLKDGEKKDASIMKCLELYPHLATSITAKSHDGMAEAALIGRVVL